MYSSMAPRTDGYLTETSSRVSLIIELRFSRANALFSGRPICRVKMPFFCERPALVPVRIH